MQHLPSRIADSEYFHRGLAVGEIDSANFDPAGNFLDCVRAAECLYPPYTYTIETKGNQSTYTVSDGTQKISLPILCTVGKRMQTWIPAREGHYHESRVSYYPSSEGIEITVGDERLTPRTLDEAIGRELKHREVTDCFGGHSTNAVAKVSLLSIPCNPALHASIAMLVQLHISWIHYKERSIRLQAV